MKWGTEVIVFLIVFFIVIILYSFYILIHKEPIRPYNFSPFPTVKPENLPNANVDHITTCEDTLQKCDPYNRDIDCSKTCGPNFTCVTVEDYDNIQYKNNPVPAGNWCLPKDDDGNTPTDLGCGTYTGRAVWSSDGEKQKWECVCLYPSLFGGPQCLSQRACIDPTYTDIQSCVVNGEEKKCNYLVDDKGRKWDPGQPDFIPPDGLSPYAKKPDGTPMFTCACNKVGSAGQKFLQLPNDPYNCHLDPCDFDHSGQLWDAEKQQCDCQKTSNQWVKSPVDGICRIGKCGSTGFFSDPDKRCKCQGGAISKLCSSDVYPRDGVPKCEDETGGGGRCNPSGSYCDDACNKKPCLNGSVCAYIDTRTGTVVSSGDAPPDFIADDYVCTCPSDTVPSDFPFNTKNYCSTTQGVGCKETTSKYVYSGKNCENRCVPSGQRIATKTPTGGGAGSCDPDYGKYVSDSACCSGSTHQEGTCAGYHDAHLVCD